MPRLMQIKRFHLEPDYNVTVEGGAVRPHVASVIVEFGSKWSDDSTDEVKIYLTNERLEELLHRMTQLVTEEFEAGIWRDDDALVGRSNVVEDTYARIAKLKAELETLEKPNA